MTKGLTLAELTCAAISYSRWAERRLDLPAESGR